MEEWTLFEDNDKGQADDFLKIYYVLNACYPSSASRFILLLSVAQMQLTSIVLSCHTCCGYTQLQINSYFPLGISKLLPFCPFTRTPFSDFNFPFNCSLVTDYVRRVFTTFMFDKNFSLHLQTIILKYHMCVGEG